MFTKVPIRRVAAVLAIACAASVTVLSSGGCATSRAPLASQSSTSTAPVTSSTPTASSTPSTTPAQVTTDAAGGAIGAPVTVSGKKKPQIGTIARPTDAVAVAKAKKLVADNDGVAVTSAQVVAMTQDTKGAWWVLLSVKEEQTGAGQAVVSFNGKAWAFQASGPTVDSTDLPKDVKF